MPDTTQLRAELQALRSANGDLEESSRPRSPPEGEPEVGNQVPTLPARPCASPRGGRRSTPSSATIHLSSAVQASTPPSAASGSGARPSDPRVQAGGSAKQEKERQRKQRLQQRKIDEAKEMLKVAMEVMEQWGVRCVSALRNVD
jgi:hypothetical protein